MLNWDDVRFLLEVSRYPKLTDAAAHLKQDASTVSRRLKRLEKELGLTLFERTRRGHILSPDGQKIAHQAELAERSFSQISRQAHTGREAITGGVRLAVTEGLGTSIIAPAVADFSRAHPAVNLGLIAMSGFANVSRREADMAILLTRPTTGRLKVRKLTDYGLQLYSTPQYLKNSPPVNSVDDLHNHVLIGYMDDMLYSDQLRYYDDISAGLTPLLSSPSIVAQLEMTRSGAGISILPRFMAERFPELTPILLDQVDVRRSFWLAIHEDVAEFSRIRAVSDFLVNLMSAKRNEMGV